MTLDLAQIIGLVAMLVGVGGYASRSDTRMKILVGVMALIMSAHFVLLGAYAGAVSTFLAGVRNLVTIRYRMPWLALIFLTLYVGLGLYHYHAWHDAFPLLAGIIGTVGMFFLTGVPLRMAIYGVCTSWLVHNIVVGSIGGVLVESFFIIANTIAVWRIMSHQHTTPEPDPIVND